MSKRTDRINRKIRRRAPVLKSIDQILIVTEDKKSSRYYLREIQQFYKLPTAKVLVVPSAIGTSPDQVVRYAIQLFQKGNPHEQIEKKYFDRIYAVFDGDGQLNYNNALTMASNFNNKYKNSNGKLLEFKAVVSIPCFELWLLLHYQKVSTALNCSQCIDFLKSPGNYPSYVKSATDIFNQTKSRLSTAKSHAKDLATVFSRATAPNPYTEIDNLVAELETLQI